MLEVKVENNDGSVNRILLVETKKINVQQLNAKQRKTCHKIKRMNQ